MKNNIWIMNHYAIGMLPSKGGRHYWLAEELKKAGYQPVVFGCNEIPDSAESYYPCEGLWAEAFSESGVKYIAIKSTHYAGNGISRVKNMSVFAMNLIKVGKQYSKLYGKPDVIYASSVHPLTVLAGERLAKHFGVPCIGEVRDLWPETLVAYGAVKQNSLFAKVLYRGERYMYEKADSMIFTMEGAPDYIREHKWDTESGGRIDISRVYNITNGVDLKQFDSNAEKWILPDEHLDNPALFCAVYTGAIKRANNLGILLKVAELLKDIDNFVILVWGTGNEVDDLKAKAKTLGLDNRFIFKGYVEKKYIPSILKRSNLNLMHWERSSVNNYGYDYNKLFEYLAAGKPIFSTIQSGHSLLVNKNCGIETCGPTPQDHADGIRHIYMMSEEQRADWGRRARMAAGDYNFAVLAKKLEAIIEAV